MPRPKKGVVPPQLRKYLFRRKAGARKMAKRRKYARVRSVSRRVYAGVRRKARRSYSASRGASLSLIDVGFSFGYGYVRNYIVGNSVFQNIASYMPFGGQYTDNIVLGLGAYLVNWLLKPTNHYIKLGLRTIVQSEAFIAGAKMNAGASFTLTNADTKSTYAGVTLN